MKRKLLFAVLGLTACLTQFANAQTKIALTWKLFPQKGESGTGYQISMPGFTNKSWINGVVPGTVFYAYVVAGKESNPDYADNIYKVDKAKYNQPYWYRAEFSSKTLAFGKRLWLNFNGINKRAEIFFNGKRLGELKGIVQRGRYDVTDLLTKSGVNAVAVLIIPPTAEYGLANRQAPTYLSSGSWDWMPAVPGLNSGITDTVALTTSGSVAIQDPWVHSDLVSKKQADVSVSVNLKNTTKASVTGNLHFVIEPGHIVVNSPAISLEPESGKTIRFDKTQFPAFSIANPKLWWPNGYGAQNMYSCKVSFDVDDQVSDLAVSTFGIRKVTADTTTLNGPMRVYINDVPVLLKGGNWGMSDYMLKVRGKDYDARIRFHKEMNFNMIRNWTGEVTDDEFYQYCDKYGIMVWDDFWLNNFGPIDSLQNFKVNAIEKVKKYRHHPSIVIWCGANEGLPGGDTAGALNMSIKNAIKDNDGNDRLYVPRSNAGATNPNFSIHGGSRNLSGSGIWGNVDPKTYFTDPHNGYLFSKDSYGMRSELGTATFVNIESFKKFMPQDYWVAPTVKSVDSKTNMWARHYFSTDGELGGGSQPVKYITSINNSYGEATSLADFCKKAQMENLETMKAMFEAWNDHMWKDATGMLIWMSQSAYPTMIWQTYDYYYDLTGAYFGAKTACEPVHIQWNAASNSIKVINNTVDNLKKLSAKAEVYGLDGKIIGGYSVSQTVDAPATSATEAFIMFAGKDTLKLPGTYFLKLKLYDAHQHQVSENFYWIGKKYLDYTALNKMPSANLLVGKPVVKNASVATHKLISYVITNNSKKTAAFGIRVLLLNNKGGQILPAIINDGYFSLMQGETKKIIVEVDAKLLAGGYKLEIKAYN